MSSVLHTYRGMYIFLATLATVATSMRNTLITLVFLIRLLVASTRFVGYLTLLTGYQTPPKEPISELILVVIVLDSSSDQVKLGW